MEAAADEAAAEQVEPDADEVPVEPEAAAADEVEKVEA